MNNSRRPLGKVGDSNKIEIKLKTVDQIERAKQRTARIEKIRTFKDNALETTGKHFRQFVNEIFVDEVPATDNVAINKRAGRTALAGAVLAVSFIGGVIAYGATHEPVTHCELVDQEAIADTPAEAATALSDLYVGSEDNGVYDRALEDFQYIGVTTVCDPELSKLAD